MTRIDDVHAPTLVREPSLQSLRSQILDWLDDPDPEVLGERRRVLVLTLDDLDALDGRRGPAEPPNEASPPSPSIDEYGLLRRGDRWVSLTPTEERVMRVLLDRAGRVCSRTLLTDAGWPRGPANERILDTYVRRLRAKVPGFGIEIRTVRRRGFLLDVNGAAVAS
jgi:hypothetical protein